MNVKNQLKNSFISKAPSDLHCRHSKPAVYTNGLDEAWASCNAGLNAHVHFSSLQIQPFLLAKCPRGEKQGEMAVFAGCHFS